MHTFTDTECPGLAAEAYSDDNRYMVLYVVRHDAVLMISGHVDRPGLNDLYADLVGYRPDDDARQELPIGELLELVAGAMLRHCRDYPDG